MAALPGSILFCCDRNAVRSPMAEGMMKRFYGTQAYVQSAGVSGDMEVDGFAVAVCREIDVPLERHRTRSFSQMEALGDDFAGFDLVVALSPAARLRAQELAAHHHVPVEFWPVLDPTGHGEAREEKLAAYREARDAIRERLVTRFGEPGP